MAMRKTTSTSKYILKITSVTKTTPADRTTILKLKTAIQSELRSRGAKNVKVEEIKVR